MSHLRATLTLYADAAREATSAMGRSAAALPLLLLGYLVLTGAELLFFSRLPPSAGLVAGFVHALLEAAIVGAYLALVEVGVLGRRRVRLSDLGEHLGAYVWDVISVLFVFWVAQLILGLALPSALVVAVPLAIVAFNPAPELVYQGRSRGMELLGDALGFMQRNWPEWLGAQLPAVGFLIAYGALVTGGFSWVLFVGNLQAFGPFFGFIRVGGDALLVAQAVGGHAGALLGAVLLLAFTHWFMLWRGFLFRELSRGSRRSRAWRARM
jgi:hypothetical protein